MRTILIIEDNFDILDNLTECLEMYGYKTLVADNGKKGIELCREFIPDLIICDIMMPETDGYEVLKLLMDSPGTCEIPFIFSTSKSEKKDVKEALSLGADDFITKPYDLDALMKMIKDLINSGSKRRKAIH